MNLTLKPEVPAARERERPAQAERRAIVVDVGGSTHLIGDGARRVAQVETHTLGAEQRAGAGAELNGVGPGLARRLLLVVGPGAGDARQCCV